jgi:hypothetical protein
MIQILPSFFLFLSSLFPFLSLYTSPGGSYTALTYIVHQSAYSGIFPAGAPLRAYVPREGRIGAPDGDRAEGLLKLHVDNFVSGDTLPTDEQAVDVIIRYSGPVDEDWPFHLEGLTVGEFLRNLARGDYSEEDPRMRYDETALLALTTPIRGRIREPWDDVREGAEKHAYPVAGAAPTLDEQGQLSPVTYDLPDASVSPVTLDDSNCQVNAGWSHGVQDAVNVVRVIYQRDYRLTPADDPRGTRSAGDGIASREITVEHRVAESIALLGEQELEVESDLLRALGSRDGAPISGDVSDETGAQVAERITRMASDRFALGGQYFTRIANRNDALVEALKTGSWCLESTSWTPEYATGTRGSNRLAQVLGRRNLDADWCELSLIDAGPANVPLGQPTLGTVTATDEGIVSVPVDAVPSGGEARVDYAIVAAGQPEPAEDSQLWTFLGRTGSVETLESPPIPAGARVWIRSRGEGTGRRPSAWTTGVSVTVTQIPRVRDLAISISEDGVPTVRWEPNSVAAGVRLHYEVHDPDAEPTLPSSEDADATAESFTFVGVKVGDTEEFTVEAEPFDGWTGSAVSGSAGPKVRASRVRDSSLFEAIFDHWEYLFDDNNTPPLHFFSAWLQIRKSQRWKSMHVLAPGSTEYDVNLVGDSFQHEIKSDGSGTLDPTVRELAPGPGGVMGGGEILITPYTAEDGAQGPGLPGPTLRVPVPPNTLEWEAGGSAGQVLVMQQNDSRPAWQQVSGTGIAPSNTDDQALFTRAGAVTWDNIGAGDIPNLDAGKITSGVFGMARFPHFEAGVASLAADTDLPTAPELAVILANDDGFDAFAHPGADRFLKAQAAGGYVWASSVEDARIPDSTAVGQLLRGDGVGAYSLSAWRVSNTEPGDRRFLTHPGGTNQTATWETLIVADLPPHTHGVGDITGAGNLTRSNDTNVTVTLGGTPTGALLKAVSLTLGWTGTLAVARGGTGVSSYTAGGLLRSTDGTTISQLSGSAGQDGFVATWNNSLGQFELTDNSLDAHASTHHSGGSDPLSLGSIAGSIDPTSQMDGGPAGTTFLRSDSGTVSWSANVPAANVASGTFAGGGSYTFPNHVQVVNTGLSTDIKLEPGTHSILRISRPAGQQAQITFETAGSNRWILMGADPVSETGSNAGSNFKLLSRTDTGAGLRTDLEIIRSTGAWTIPGAVTMQSTLQADRIGIGRNPSSTTYALWTSHVGDAGGVTGLRVDNVATAATTNAAILDFVFNTDTQLRTYFRLRAFSSTITDASRTSTIEFLGADNGSFTQFLTAVGTAVAIPGTLNVTGVSKLANSSLLATDGRVSILGDGGSTGHGGGYRLHIGHTGDTGVGFVYSYDSDLNAYRELRLRGNPVVFSQGDVSIPSGKKFFLDDGGDTYLREVSANIVQVVAGSNAILEVTGDRIRPAANGTLASGSSSRRWSTIYGVDADLSGKIVATGTGASSVGGNFAVGGQAGSGLHSDSITSGASPTKTINWNNGSAQKLTLGAYTGTAALTIGGATTNQVSGYMYTLALTATGGTRAYSIAGVTTWATAAPDGSLAQDTTVIITLWIVGSTVIGWATADIGTPV